MMIQPTNSTYILSPVNHKEWYKLTEDTTIFIAKFMENNLRERNPQLGVVEGVPSDNPYNLQVGDIVAVHHFTFYGDIGPQKTFVMQNHFEWEGKPMFPVLQRQIFFKYNNQNPEPVGDFLLCTNVDERDVLTLTDHGFNHETKWKQRGLVTHGEWEGKEVLVLSNAFYLITLDKKDYFKVRKDEVVGVIENGAVTPVGNNILIEYVPEFSHSFLDLSLVKKPIHIKAKVIKNSVKDNKTLIKWQTEGLPDEGEYVLVYRNQGVEYNGMRIIDLDTIIWVYEKAG